MPRAQARGCQKENHATSKKHDIFLSFLDSFKKPNDRVLHKRLAGGPNLDSVLISHGNTKKFPARKGQFFFRLHSCWPKY